jgi:uncharacterized membrane protein YeaQ/YmgE (transglycosylase-associated protein family)
MYFLSWVMIGSMIGWLTGKLVQEAEYEPIANIVAGVGGAVGCGLVARLATAPNYRGLAYTTVVAILGAAIVAGANAYFTVRNRYA